MSTIALTGAKSINLTSLTYVANVAAISAMQLLAIYALYPAGVYVWRLLYCC
jgi:hypothetical protein